MEDARVDQHPQTTPKREAFAQPARWRLKPPLPVQWQLRREASLLAGPERIESGWWDGGDVARDYFVAETADRTLVWVYRERRAPGGWFLHGLFA